MRILVALFLLLASCGVAAAQGCGPQNPNCIVPTAPVGTNNNQAASTEFVQQATGGGTVVHGPNSSVAGDVAIWNNTTGTLLADSGSTLRYRQTATPTYYYVNAGSAGNICSPNNLTTPQTCGAGIDSVTPQQASTVVAGVVAQPYATLQGALASILGNVDMAFNQARIVLAHGAPATAYGAASCETPMSSNGGSLWIQGDDNDNTAVTLTAPPNTYALYVTHYCVVRLRSVTVSDSGTGLYGLQADSWGGVDVQNVITTAFNGTAIRIGQDGHLELVSPLNVDSIFVKGNAATWLRVDTGGNANFGSSAGTGPAPYFSVNIGAGLTFSNALISVPSGGVLFNMTSGTFTGNNYTGTGLLANGFGFLETNANVPCATVFAAASNPCPTPTDGFQTDANDPMAFNSRISVAPVATLPDNTNALTVTATQPSSTTQPPIGILFNITSAGSTAQVGRAFRVVYNAGYTGSSQTNAFSVVNGVAGAANTLIANSGTNSVLGNLGNSGSATGVALTTGTNAGGAFFAANGSVNAGAVGMAQVPKNSALNIGVVGSAINTGTTPIEIGGWFSLNQTTNPTVSAALIADNGAESQPIFLARANGVTVATIDQNGNLNLASGLKYKINGSQIACADLSNAGTACPANVATLGPVVAAWSGTAPTISAGFCSTSPSITASNGTAAFDINVGTSCSGSVGTLSMPAATTGWACNFQDVTTPASYIIGQTGGATNTVSLTSYSRTTGLASNFTASDHIRASCMAY